MLKRWVNHQFNVINILRIEQFMHMDIVLLVLRVALDDF